MRTKIDVHVLGSLKGYSTLRRSAGLRPEIVSELEQVDLLGVIQLEASSNSMSPTFNQLLSDGRFALRRVVRGGRDDMGRRTVTVVSLILTPTEYIGVCQNLGPLIRSSSVWSSALQSVDDAWIEIDDPVIDSIETSIDLFQRYVHAAAAEATLFLDKQELPGFLGFLARLHPDDKRQVLWCIGARRTNGMGVCILEELDADASQARVSPVPKLRLNRAALTAGEFFPCIAEACGRKSHARFVRAPRLGTSRTRTERSWRGHPRLVLLALGVGTLLSGVVLAPLFSGRPDSQDGSTHEAEVSPSAPRDVGAGSSLGVDRSASGLTKTKSPEGAVEDSDQAATDSRIATEIATASETQVSAPDQPRSISTQEVDTADQTPSILPSHGSADESGAQGTGTDEVGSVTARDSNRIELPNDPGFHDLVTQARDQLEQLKAAIQEWKQVDEGTDLVRFARQYVMFKVLSERGRRDRLGSIQFELNGHRLDLWFPEDEQKDRSSTGESREGKEKPPTDYEVVCIGLLNLLLKESKVTAAEVARIFRRFEFELYVTSFDSLTSVINTLDFKGQKPLSIDEKKSVAALVKSSSAAAAYEFLSDSDRLDEIWVQQSSAKLRKVLEELRVLRRIDTELESGPWKNASSEEVPNYCFMTTLESKGRSRKLDARELVLVDDLADKWCAQLTEISELINELRAIMVHSEFRPSLPEDWVRVVDSKHRNQFSASDLSFFAGCFNSERIAEELAASRRLRER